MGRKITKLPQPTQLATRLRVAAYARVSCEKEEMLHSLAAQVSFYSNRIQSNPEWQYVGVYADEAETGTKGSRPEFQRLIADCRKGLIDLVLTKAISRFARNTVTLLETVRELKDLGIGVYFEEQNLHSLSGDGELMLTILASYAQEESRSVSENCKWRIRKNYKEGKPSNNIRIYGYDYTAGKLTVIPEEAEVVRMIFADYLSGLGKNAIMKKLIGLGIPTKCGGRWMESTVSSILTNEKYKGDALLQKTFTDNYLDHSSVKNTGQIPQYYVENNHPAIIERDLWEQVQFEIDRRNKIGAKYSSSDIFASKLICEDCGGFYGKKKWHSNSKYSRFIYQCNKKFGDHKEKCLTPHLTEEDIKLKFIKAYNITMKDKKRVIKDTKNIIELLTDTTELEVDISKTDDELVVIAELVNKLVKENSKTSIALDEYNKKYEELKKCYEKTKAKKKHY